MPRVENCGPSVEEFCQRTGNGSSTHDICRDCADDLASDPHCYDDKLKPYNEDPEGEDGWQDLGCSHPEYATQEDEGFRSYYCEVCNKKLGEEDE